MAVTDLLDVLMFVAVALMLMTGFPVAFALAGTALFFALLGHAVGAFDLRFIAFIPQRVFGTMTNEILLAVPLFIFMGIMLERSKVAEELLESMGRLFGRLRGGLGISVSIVGALLAASTGIVGATVVTMGLLSLPTMLRHGYDPRLACGSICAAGTLGQIIPPSIVLVLLGDVISSAYQAAQLEQGVFNPQVVSVGDLFAGALLPGLLLVGLYILYQVAVGLLRPGASPAMPAEDAYGDAGRLALYLRLLRVLAAPVVLIVAVLGSILAGIATPTEAAGVGALGATLLAGLKQERQRRAALLAAACLAGLLVLTANVDLRLARLDIPTGDKVGIGLAILLCCGLVWGVWVTLVGIGRAGVLTAVVRSTTQITSMVFLIVIGAALFSLVFRGLGGDETVRDFLTGLPGGTAGAVIVVMATMFVLGFFIDFVEIVFIVVPVVAPVLLAMGVDPVWLGVMMAMNLQTSFLTPPFGFALFYLRGVAPPEVRTTDIYRGVAPFVLLQLAALGLLALFPAMATWLPDLVFGG